MRARIRLVAVSLAIAGVLVAAVAIASAAGRGGGDPTATPSLGVHDEKTQIGSLAARPDGGLLAVQDQRIRSFGPDGTPGPDFAPRVDPSGASLFPVADGKSLVVGDQKLTRLDPGGGIDKTFGVGGSVKTGYSNPAVHELGSGRIALVDTVVSGTKTVTAYVSVEVLGQDGQRVKGAGVGSSLANAGVVPGGGIEVPEISSTADGGALVVGENFLLELNADGSADTDFGGAGLVDDLFGLVGGHQLPDGSIETVAPDPRARGGDVVLTRYTAAGQPDVAFGPEGERHLEASSGPAEAKVVSWGADGSVIVGGDAVGKGPCPESECEEAPFLAAFDASGEREAGFAADGVLRLARSPAPPAASTPKG